MAAPVTPYTKYLGDREPLSAIRESTQRIQNLTADWTAAQYERSYEPGKWNARQILTHLAHVEMAFGTRIRMALTVENYVAQSFDQDPWLAREPAMSGPDARDTFLRLNRMNLALFASLSPADRSRTFSHPEFGAIQVDYIIYTSAGHEINHLLQLEQIAQQPAGASVSA